MNIYYPTILNYPVIYEHKEYFIVDIFMIIKTVKATL